MSTATSKFHCTRERRRGGPRSAWIVGALLMIAGAFAMILGLAGCSQPPPFALQNITGLMPRLEFRLTDDDNQVVTAQDFRGRVLLLYFGYTHCPDICPTTLAALSQALSRLGPDASKVRVLFVTVDPQRDSAPLLKRYMGYFGPQFVGLFGDDSALRPLVQRYRVAYHRDPPDAHGNYAVEHSSVIFVFDQRGRVRLLGRSGDPPEFFARDLQRLIRSD